MAERAITIPEIQAVRELAKSIERVLDGEFLEQPSYEAELDNLIDIARPELLETPEAPSSSAAPGEAAAPLTIPGGGGGLITEEGLFDALTALHRDAREGHFQTNEIEWAKDAFEYILRHAQRLSEEQAEVDHFRACRIADFVSQECTLGSEVEVRKGTLYNTYIQWCGLNALLPATESRFAREISALGLKQKHSNGAWWVGIGLTKGEATAA